MDKFFDELNKAKQSATLAADAKARIHARLVQFMEAEEGVAVRKEMAGRQGIQRSWLYLFNFKKPMPIIATILIALMLGGGVSAAAEKSLPGDLLYPVKIYANEEVRSAASLTKTAKASWDVELAERRLDEAAKLAVLNKLDTKTRADLDARFNENAKSANLRLTELSAEGKIATAADIASHFEGVLRARAKIFGDVQIEHPENSDELDLLDTTLGVALKDAIKLRISTEDKITSATSSPATKTAAEGKIKAATNVIASVRAELERDKAGVSATASTSATARLAVADELVIEAKAHITAGAYGTAFAEASAALRTAEIARALLHARADLKIEIRDDKNDNENEEGVEATTSARTMEESDDNGGSVRVRINGEIDADHDGSKAETRGNGEMEFRLDL